MYKTMYEACRLHAYAVFSHVDVKYKVQKIPIKTTAKWTYRQNKKACDGEVQLCVRKIKIECRVVELYE